MHLDKEKVFDTDLCAINLLRQIYDLKKNSDLDGSKILFMHMHRICIFQMGFIAN